MTKTIHKITILTTTIAVILLTGAIAIPLQPVASGVPDTDGDGIDDLSDNCPFTFNPGQDDFDLDGFGDICDPDPFDPACPLVECPPFFEPSAEGRDNTTVTHINLEWPQKLILVDNAGIGGISDVEVTWRFDPTQCMVQMLPPGASPSVPGSWVLMPNDMVFGAFAAHADAFDVEAVALSAVSDDDECELDDDDGEFVTVSTVFALPPPIFNNAE